MASDDHTSKERTEITSFRLSQSTRAKLKAITNSEARASDNNTVIWLIEKEYRKLQRRQTNGKKR